jgi:hypothetical protein
MANLRDALSLQWREGERTGLATNSGVFLNICVFSGHYQLPSFVFKTFRRLKSFPSSGKNPTVLGQTDRGSDYFAKQHFRIIFVVER